MSPDLLHCTGCHRTIETITRQESYLTYHYAVQFTDGSEYSGVKSGIKFLDLYNEIMADIVTIGLDTQCITKIDITEES